MRPSIPACTLPLTALVISDLAVTGAGQPMLATAGGAAASVIGVGVLMMRGYKTVDVVLSAAENQTVHVIEAVGDAGMSLLPVVIGATVTMILLCLHVAVRRWWKSPKTELSDSGKNPEGNAGVGTCQALLNDESRREKREPQAPVLKFPPLTWCTSDMLARTIANYPDACTIADLPDMIGSADYSQLYICWKVDSQSGGKPYTVRLSKDALEQTPVPPKKIRELISCGCPGHMFSLKDAQEDRICKHCGAVMIQCVRINRVRVAASSTQLTAPRPSGPAGSAARRDSHSCTRNRRGKNQSIAICDKQAETIGPAVTTSAQADASEDRVSKHVGALLRHAGAVRTCAYPHRRVFKPTTKEEESLETRVLRIQAEGMTEVKQVAVGNKTESGRVADALSRRPDDMVRSLDAMLFQELSPGGRFFGYDQRAPNAAHFPARGCGLVLSLLKALQSQAMASHLIKTTKKAGFVSCFTFDLDELTDDIGDAAVRGPTMTVVADRKHALGGVTKAMADRLTRLKSRGVVVYLADGPQNGIQHSKVVLSDGMLLVGSTNWTGASQRNCELDALIKLSDDGIPEWDAWRCAVLERAELMTAQQEEVAHKTREDRASSAQNEKYRTAKKFSIARARSHDALQRSQGNG